MTIVILVFLIRFLVPLTILRWPFWGMVAAIIADAYDFTVFTHFGGLAPGEIGYQRFDKFLDTYALFIGFLATRQLLEENARRILGALFAWRFLGVIVFEIVGARYILFFAPNIFEYFYLLVFGIKTFAPQVSLLNNRTLALLLITAAVPKIIVEYTMHVRQYPLSLGNIWRFITGVNR